MHQVCAPYDSAVVEVLLVEVEWGCRVQDSGVHCIPKPLPCTLTLHPKPDVHCNITQYLFRHTSASEWLATLGGCAEFCTPKLE